MENSMEFPPKSINRNTIQPSNSNPRNLPEVNKISDLKRYMQSYAYCFIIYSNQEMEATKVSIKDEWINVHILWLRFCASLSPSPISPTHPKPYPMVTTNIISVSMSLLLFCSFCFVLILDSLWKWNHIFVLLYLAN